MVKSNKKKSISMIQKNTSQLFTPWQSQSINMRLNDEQNYRYSTLQVKQQNDKNNQNLFPRVSPRLTFNRHGKISLQLPKKQISVDEKSQKTFQQIRRAKQNSFNGFLTKYKNEPKQSKRYFLASNLRFFSINQEIRNINGGDRVKMINLSSAISNYNQNNEDIVKNRQNVYITKQVQLSKKRSLTNMIKSIQNEKFFKVRAQCKNSPWMMTSRVEVQKNDSIQKDNIKKTIKLMELNLDIRQRNYNKYMPKK